MSKIIDNTNLGYLIGKIKSAFWRKSETSELAIDSSPTSNSNNLVSSGGVKSALDTKQDALVSGTSIKTINNESLLGSGNISVSGGTGGEANVIEAITFNGTPATITNKTAAITATIPSTLDQIADGSTRKLSNYLPLAGGTMEDDAEVEFTDGESRTVTITPSTVDLHSADDAWRVVIDPSTPGMQVGDEDFNSCTLYTQDGISNKIGSNTYYNIVFPNKSGTFALTSDIPSSVGNLVDGQKVMIYDNSHVLTAVNGDGITGIFGDTDNHIYALGSNNADGNEDYILATTDQIPTVPTTVSSFTNDANYVKYVLCADEAAYNAISNKDSGTLYLIPVNS